MKIKTLKTKVFPTPNFISPISSTPQFQLQPQLHETPTLPKPKPNPNDSSSFSPDSKPNPNSSKPHSNFERAQSH